MELDRERCTHYHQTKKICNYPGIPKMCAFFMENRKCKEAITKCGIKTRREYQPTHWSTDAVFRGEL